MIKFLKLKIENAKFKIKIIMQKSKLVICIFVFKINQYYAHGCK
jgi:hypothetical protein